MIGSSFLSHLKQSLELRIWDFAGWKYKSSMVPSSSSFCTKLMESIKASNSAPAVPLRQGQTKQQKEAVISSILVSQTNAFHSQMFTDIGRIDSPWPAKKHSPVI